MKTNTATSILSIIEKKGNCRPHDLVAELGLSAVAVHRQLRSLVAKGAIVKVGKSPRVYYALPNVLASAKNVFTEVQPVIDTTYLYVHPNGALMYGMPGFVHWAVEVNKTKNLSLLAKSYVETRKMADGYIKSGGWIDGSEKMRSTFHDTVLDVLAYKDFYSLPVFGKTILGQLVLYAKQSQDRTLIAEIAQKVSESLVSLLTEFAIDFVAFIPATIPREIQFMKLFEQFVALPKPTIRLRKIRTGDVLVAQKSLSKLQERIDNARATILVETTKNTLQGKRILLVDDAVGSGATMHEVAKKLKTEGAAFVVGFAPVGSFKGFDVLQEV